MSAKYQIRITDPRTQSIVTIFQPSVTFQMQFTKTINEIDTIAFTVLEEIYPISLFLIDNIVDVQRQMPDGAFVIERSFFIRKTERFAAEDGERLLVSGVSLEHMFLRRIIDPADDSVQPNGGYATKDGGAATVIAAYLREQAGQDASIARAFPRLTIQTPTMVSENIGRRLRYENLWKEMKDLAHSVQLDIWIVHEGKAVFTGYVGMQGTDKSKATNIIPPYTVFSTNRGNLISPRLTINRNSEKTYIIALGDGEGASRTEIRLTSSDINDSPYNRIEVTVDSRSENKGTAGALAVLTDARQALIDNEKKIDFEFDIETDVSGAIYRVDWVLGDILTVEWDGVQYTRRINLIKVSLNGNTEVLTVDAGNL